MTDGDILIRLIQPHDYDEVAQFIQDYFIADEPLCSCEPKFVASESNLNELKDVLAIGTSILAAKVHENGDEELAGVNIGMPKVSSCIEEYFMGAEKAGNTKYGNMLKFMGIASRKSDVFNRYGVEEIFYSYMLSIKRSYRGLGYGARLKKELTALARKWGYKVIATDCTSFYSSELCKRLGWDEVNYFVYADFKDENGKQIFAPPAPHDGMTTFALRL